MAPPWPVVCAESATSTSVCGSLFSSGAASSPLLLLPPPTPLLGAAAASCSDNGSGAQQQQPPQKTLELVVVERQPAATLPPPQWPLSTEERQQLRSVQRQAEAAAAAPSRKRRRPSCLQSDGLPGDHEDDGDACEAEPMRPDDDDDVVIALEAEPVERRAQRFLHERLPRNEYGRAVQYSGMPESFAPSSGGRPATARQALDALQYGHDLRARGEQQLLDDANEQYWRRARALLHIALDGSEDTAAHERNRVALGRLQRREQRRPRPIDQFTYTDAGLRLASVRRHCTVRVRERFVDQPAEVRCAEMRDLAEFVGQLQLNREQLSEYGFIERRDGDAILLPRRARAPPLPCAYPRCARASAGQRLCGQHKKEHQRLQKRYLKVAFAPVKSSDS